MMWLRSFTLKSFLLFNLFFFSNGLIAEEEKKLIPERIIEAIKITNSIETDKKVIFDILPFRVGEILRTEDLIFAKIIAQNTGFIRDLDFKIKKGSKRGRIILLIRVIERNSLYFDSFILGFDRMLKPFGGMSIVDMNLLGTGARSSFKFALGDDQQGYKLDYRSPTHANRSFFYTVSLKAINGREVVLDDSKKLLEIRVEDQMNYRRRGAQLEFGFSLGNFYYFLLGAGSEYQKSFYPHLYKPVNSYLPFMLSGKSFMTSLHFSFVRDSTNSVVFPTRGSRLSFNFLTSDSAFASDYEFSKQGVDLDIYKSMLGNHRFHFRTNAGLIQGKAPFFKKFFRGDYSYFQFGKNSLPRFLEMNFSEVSEDIKYGDLLVSVGADYSIPVVWGLFNNLDGYTYFAVDLTHSGDRDDEFQFPLSFDLGITFDSRIGLIKLSTSYFLDVIL